MGHNETEPLEPEKLHESALTPFDRRVAVTIAILSAILAYVSMLDSTTHSELVSLQTTANREHIEANGALTQSEELLTLSTEARQTAIRHEDTNRIIRLLPVASEGRAGRDELQKELVQSIAQKKAEAASLKLQSNEKKAQYDEIQLRSQRTLDEADRLHKEAKSIGRGELLIQLAIVMCSLAILTKRRWYWYSGMVLGGSGLFVARIATSVAPLI
jgi:hypothetical protein